MWHFNHLKSLKFDFLWRSAPKKPAGLATFKTWPGRQVGRRQFGPGHSWRLCGRKRSCLAPTWLRVKWSRSFFFWKILWVLPCSTKFYTCTYVATACCLAFLFLLNLWHVFPCLSYFFPTLDAGCLALASTKGELTAPVVSKVWVDAGFQAVE